MGYTLKQFLRYLGLARKRERTEMRWQLTSAFLVRVGGQPLQNAFKALED